jgi:hypothetical protein
MFLKDKRQREFLLFFFALQLIAVAAVFAEKTLSSGSVEKRDPFISLVTEDGRLLKLATRNAGELNLDGIIYDANGLSCAMINKEIVRIGDWVGDYQVYKIENDKVILLKDGIEKEIEPNKEESCG